MNASDAQFWTSVVTPSHFPRPDSLATDKIQRLLLAFVGLYCCVDLFLDRREVE